jgi:phosphoglycerate dehydrogenase-like enzyme
VTIDGTLPLVLLPRSEKGAKSVKKKVLITKEISYFPDIDKVLSRDVEVVHSSSNSEGDILAAVRDMNGIIAPDTAITRKVIDAATELQVIATPQAGFDKIDIEAATRAGVPVLANAGLSADAVAEFTLGLMIALARRIVGADHDLRQQKNWKVRRPYVIPSLNMGTEIHGSTIGLVGLGSIGSTVARLCRSALSARVIAYDPYVSVDRMKAQGIEKCDALPALASQADFVSLHMALTDKTYHLIDEKIFRAMKPAAYFINCARGDVVDEKAFIRALQEKWIRGAATDVFEHEPVDPDNPLLDMPNVIVTPHIAGLTVQSCSYRSEVLVKRLLGVLAGNQTDGVVNPEVWPQYLKRLNSRRS